MKPSDPAPGQADWQPGGQPRRRPPLLSPRSALIFAMALLVAIGAAILLDLAHRPAALIALSAVVAFAAAAKFLDWLVGD